MKFLLILKVLTAYGAVVPVMQPFESLSQCEFVKQHITDDRPSNGDFFGKGSNVAPSVYSGECLRLPETNRPGGDCA